ncbi:hypothetical protein DL767_000970 [Monosporascus sp. MG133]|nr:hypothetical protein DL767_000970 [Monosporascus sp. MG133]
MTENPTERGVALIEASQTIWGASGRKLVIFGLAMIMILFELDNTTLHVYTNYSTSEFGALSTLGSLFTASMIVFAVVKLPIAKLSNVIGRGYTLAITVSMYTISYVLMASAPGIGSYAAGSILYRVGQSGTNVMTTVIISDITSPRWRGFALGVFYFPFLITPWVSGLIVDSVVKGIGWRWGVGMFAILMPLGACVIIGALIYYQHKVKKDGFVPSNKPTIRSFCSDIDLGGMALFVAGFGLLLLPITIAGSLPDGWGTPWIIALMVIGFLILLALSVYEKFVAVNPMLPVFYFKKATIVLSILLIAIDSLGLSVTHTYLYAWATVSHNMSVRVATFFLYATLCPMLIACHWIFHMKEANPPFQSFTNGITQCLMGIVGGWIMLATGRYKWLVMGGAVVRLIGYGLMCRLRGQENSIGELFTQQVIQGIGSGIMQISLLVPPQIVVPHAQISQALSLTLSMSFLGYSVGSAIAGGIYTNMLRPSLWAYLGRNATQELVDELYNSITGVLPGWGTPERDAVNLAYTDVTRSFAYAALGASVVAILMCYFLPDLLLPKDRVDLSGSGVAEEELGDLRERI